MDINHSGQEEIFQLDIKWKPNSDNGMNIEILSWEGECVENLELNNNTKQYFTLCTLPTQNSKTHGFEYF